MSSWRQQALIEAPVEEVWAMLVDPVRYSEWNGDVLEVTGAPTRVEQGSTFDLTSSGPLRLKSTTTFKVERLDELREIKMQCRLSGFYSHWLLTEARGSTFAEVELGVEAKPGVEARVAGALHTKRYLRRAVDQMLDGLRREVGRLTRPR